jgi:hypothetical protein
MGLLIYDALVIAKVAALNPGGRSVLTLGVPTLNFSAEAFGRELDNRPDLRHPWPFTNHLEFFHGLRFDVVDSLDISEYEGANIKGDLNDPMLADKIGRKYDLVYDSGTIEHIFDVAAALRTISRLTRLGGAVVHATPANGFLDHGFWQFSPDVFRAFYRHSGFSMLTSALLVLGENVHAVRADENFYRSHGRRYIVERFPEAIAVFAAVNRADRGPAEIPLQDYYALMHQGGMACDTSEFFIEFGSPNVGQAQAVEAHPKERWFRSLFGGRT